MDPDERIVDYALLRLFHGQPEVDLSQSVRKAWERGVPGPSLDDLDWDDLDWDELDWEERDGEERDGDALEREPRRTRSLARARTRPARVHLFATYARVAAAALVLAVGAAWVLDRGTPSDRVGSLSRSLPRLEDGRWVPNAQESVGDGVPIWVDGLQPVRVALERGGSLEVDPGSLFTLYRHEDGTRVDLEWGALRLHAAAASPLWVSSSGTTVALAAGGRLAATLEWERESPAPQQLHLIQPTRSRNARGSLGLLSLNLLEGQARLASGAGGALEPGRPLEVALETLGPRTLPAGEGQRLAQELEELFELAEGAQLMQTQAWGYRPDQKFLAFAAELREEQAHWFHLRQLLQKLLASPKIANYVRSEILSLLALDGGAIASALAVDLWGQHPAWFQVDQLLALAESGVSRFARELVSIVTESDSLGLDPLYLEELGLEELGIMQPFLPAVYLALRGDDVGQALLRDVARASAAGASKGADKSLAVLSAVALERLGIEAPWAACRVELERAVFERLDASDLDGAIEQVLNWEYLTGRLAGDQPPRISFLPLRLAEHRDRRRAAFLTREDVEALVEQLLRR